MIIMILGMHRSGTSTISGVLHMNGVVMGTYQNFWPRPLNQNPKGFYENYDFRKINDHLLSKSGYHVESFLPNIPNIQQIDSLSRKMKLVIEKSNSTYQNWGWKDPRTCLTAIHWADAIDSLGLQKKLKIIFMARKASSVSRSLNKRNNLPINQGLELWESYTKRAISFMEDNSYPTYHCSFEDLLRSPVQVCDSLFNFLGKDWDSEIVEKFIDPSISTSENGNVIEYSDNVAALEKKIYSYINDYS